MNTFRIAVDIDGEIFAAMRFTFLVDAETKEEAEKLALAASTDPIPDAEDYELVYESIDESSFNQCFESADENEFFFRRIADNVPTKEIK
jgi:hypothetical protein